MSKFFVLYWQPGSGGDCVQQLLLAQGMSGVIEKFDLTSSGRLSPILAPVFRENFEHEQGQWYWRTWSLDDCVKLKELSDGTFVIPTHRLDQVDFLVTQVENCKSIGITYPENIFYLVLKNWCKKVAPNDLTLAKIYNKPQHKYLKDNDVFGEFILSEQLKFGTEIKSSVKVPFDISISLENLYNSNVSDLAQLITIDSNVDALFASWLSSQSKLHTYRYHIDTRLEQALGYNSTAEKTNNLDISLDIFDNILIKHHFPSVPNFNTLEQANNFIKASN